MPVLTLPLGHEGGAVDLLIGVSYPRADALRAANLPIPPPVPIRAIIDPGASATCVEAGALQSLGLVSTGTISMTTPSTGNVPVVCNQYDVSLTVVHPNVQMTLPALAIVECQPLGGTIQALIGRDFLSVCLFVYDGVAQRFSLGY